MLYFRLLLVIPLLALNAIAWAQQKEKTDQRPVPTLRIETDLVTIDVTATDKNGNYVRDLRPEEFQVFEDGKLKKLDFFAMTDESTFSRPLAVVFALDTSGSLKPEETRMLREAAGKFTEVMSGESVFAAMAHPYTRGLLAARPQLAPRTAQPVRLSTIAGTVPELVDLPAGCAFAGRCAFTAQACHHTRPEATLVAQDADGDHLVRCLRPEAMVPAATPAHVVESALPVHSRS